MKLYLKTELRAFRSLKEFKDEMRFIVDLDQERGIAAREGRTPNTHRVAIRKTNAVNLAAITGYLEGKMQFGNAVLEAISKNIPC